MIEAIQLEAQPLNRGRPTKFTPERIQQVRNLVERGKGPDEIAEIIGVSTGSLQVVCSKLGISLRRPTFYAGTGLLPRPWSRDHKSGSPTQSSPRPESTEPESVTEPRPVLLAAKTTGKARPGTPGEGAWHRKLENGPPAMLVIRMEYNGQERSTNLPLDEEIIGELAMEAQIRGMGLGELVGALIFAIAKQHLFHLVEDDS